MGKVISPAVFFRGTAHFFQELSVEIGEIAVTAAKGDVGDFVSGGGKRVADRIQPQLCQMFDSADAGGFFKAFHKIAFAQMDKIGKLFDCNVVLIISGHIFESRPDYLGVAGFMFLPEDNIAVFFQCPEQPQQLAF